MNYYSYTIVQNKEWICIIELRLGQYSIKVDWKIKKLKAIRNYLIDYNYLTDQLIQGTIIDMCNNDRTQIRESKICFIYLTYL